MFTMRIVPDSTDNKESNVKSEPEYTEVNMYILK